MDQKLIVPKDPIRTDMIRLRNVQNVAALKEGVALYPQIELVPKIKRCNNMNTNFIKNMRKGVKNKTKWLHITDTEKKK